jgi:hypothetical protein
VGFNEDRSGLLAMGFLGPRRPGMSSSPGSPRSARQRAGQYVDYATSFPGFSRRATCGAGNRWWLGDPRGPAVCPAIDEALVGATTLPR